MPKSTVLTTVDGNNLSMFIMPPKNIVLIVQNSWLFKPMNKSLYCSWDWRKKDALIP